MVAYLGLPLCSFTQSMSLLAFSRSASHQCFSRDSDQSQRRVVASQDLQALWLTRCSVWLLPYARSRWLGVLISTLFERVARVHSGHSDRLSLDHHQMQVDAEIDVKCNEKSPSQMSIVTSEDWGRNSRKAPLLVNFISVWQNDALCCPSQQLQVALRHCQSNPVPQIAATHETTNHPQKHNLHYM